MSTIGEIKREVRTWQRMLRLGGYYAGAVDSVIGPQTRAAEIAWAADEARHKAEVGSFDERTESNLVTLLPVAQRAVREWLVLVAKKVVFPKGYEMKIICGTRSYAEQNALYAKGGVTQARGGQSWHNFGLAVDMGIFSDSGKKYHGSHALYKTCGKLASQVSGLEWGGDWVSFKDEPHVQVARFASVAKARAEFEKS